MNKNIVVAFGGISPEHEVSVLTAMQAISALQDTSYSVLPLYISKSGRWYTGDHLLELDNYQDLDEVEEKAISCTFSHDSTGQPVLLELERSGLFSSRNSHRIYAVLTSFHGSEGENGGFQGTCEMFNIPYSGSGVFASALSMDKIKAKELCAQHEVPVVEGFSFSEQKWEQNRDRFLDKVQNLSYPVIVKPVRLGSSIGVQKAETREELITAVEESFRYDEYLMVERAVSPLMEINCSVLGDENEARPSVCERPVAEEEFLSFEDKYQNEGGGEKGMASADRVVPADIPDDLSEEIQTLSLKIFSICQVAGVARLDFLVNKNTSDIYFNEINTIPGSFSFYLWEEHNMEFTDLMLELIEIARRRHQRKNGRIRSYDTNLLSQKAVKGLKGLKNKGKEDT